MRPPMHSADDREMAQVWVESRQQALDTAKYFLGDHFTAEQVEWLEEYLLARDDYYKALAGTKAALYE
jgi:hypothetical protein